MACSAVRSPILRNSTIQVRNYAAAAKAAQSCSGTSIDTQIQSNKVIAAALDNNSGISQVSVTFKVGSRNESYENQGISHMLRLSAGLSTTRSSIFGITRNIQQLGGNLYATSDRETISYTLQVTRNHLEKALYFLEDVVSRPAFKPWEVDELLPRIRYELSTLPGHIRIVELLHKAAYRSGLGNSLYAPKRQIGKISSETLQHFVNTWQTGAGCAVVGTGISQSEIAAFASNLNLPSGNPATTPSKYVGGELRKDRDSPLATVAIAVETPGFVNENETLAFAILQRAAGSGPHAKWGSSNAPLQRAVAMAAGSDPFAVCAFNASYSDSGLFGLILSAPAEIAGTLTKAANKWLTTPNITDVDIARGKYELKASILETGDSYVSQLDNISQQAVFKGRISSVAALAADVEKISAADVKKAAAKLNGKISMAAIGNLSTVPQINELN